MRVTVTGATGLIGRRLGPFAYHQLRRQLAALGLDADDVFLLHDTFYDVQGRALQPAVLWRKGCFGTDSEAGSRFVERLLTVGVICRQQGLNLVEFLYNF